MMSLFNTFLLLSITISLLGCSSEIKAPVDLLEGHSQIEIDGLLDSLWNEHHIIQVRNIGFGFQCVENEKDLSARFRVAYDENAMYFLIEVLDDIKYVNRVRATNTELTKIGILDEDWSSYDNDGVELFFDPFNNKLNVFDPKNDDFKVNVVYGINANFNSKDTPQIKSKSLDTNDGYNVEIKIPFSVFKTKPFKGQKIGFELCIIDNDASHIDSHTIAVPQSKLCWAEETGFNAWSRTDLYGTLIIEDNF